MTTTLAPLPLPRAAVTGRHDADHGRLLIQCPDRPGIVSAISTFLNEAGASIVALDQHSTEEDGGQFFQRTEFHLPGLAAARQDLADAFASEVAACFDMDFRLIEAARPSEWRSWYPRPTTVCWTCCGAIAGASST